MLAYYWGLDRRSSKWLHLVLLCPVLHWKVGNLFSELILLAGFQHSHRSRGAFPYYSPTVRPSLSPSKVSANFSTASPNQAKCWLRWGKLSLRWACTACQRSSLSSKRYRTNCWTLCTASTFSSANAILDIEGDISIATHDY